MPSDPRDICHADETCDRVSIHPVTTLQGEVKNSADGEIPVKKIFAFTVVCLILSSIRNLLKTIDPAGNAAWYLPSNKAGLHQK